MVSILLRCLFIYENEAGRSEYLTYFRNPVFIVGFFLMNFSTMGIKRHRIIHGNETAPPPVVSPPLTPLHPDLTWPTPGGINKTEARRICQLSILESSVHYLCDNFTLMALHIITTSCMLDLQVNTAFQSKLKRQH